MGIDERHIIQRQGKDYALYVGLLDEAHAQGLHSIDTLLVQPPTEKNGNVAIVTAKVTMDTHAEPGERRTFMGIGDASPENLSRNMVPASIRMAETRAKARALRDAINVSEAIHEDEGGEEPPRATPRDDGGELPGVEYGVDTWGDRERVEPLASLIRDAWGDKGLQKFVVKEGPLEELSADELQEWTERVKSVLAARQRR